MLILAKYSSPKIEKSKIGFFVEIHFLGGNQYFRIVCEETWMTRKCQELN